MIQDRDLILDYAAYSQQIPEYQRQFHSSGDFHCLILRDFLAAEITQKLLEESGLNKDLIVLAEQDLPTMFKKIVWELNSGSFISLLQEIVGLEALMPDAGMENSGLFRPASIEPVLQHHRNRYGLVSRLQLILPIPAEIPTSEESEPVLTLTAGSRVEPIGFGDCLVLAAGQAVPYQLAANSGQVGEIALVLHYYRQEE